MTKLEVFNQAKEQLSKTHELTIDSENKFKLTIDEWDLVFKNTDEHNTVQAFSVDGIFESHDLEILDDHMKIILKCLPLLLNNLNSEYKQN